MFGPKKFEIDFYWWSGRHDDLGFVAFRLSILEFGIIDYWISNMIHLVAQIRY